MTDIFLVAFNAILINKVRSFLTMLGVIIGVGSVVLLTSIGTGLQAYVTDQFSALGTNTLYVMPGNPFGGNAEQSAIQTTRATLKQSHLRDIIKDNRDVITEGVATGVGVAKASYRNTNKNITLYAVTPEYATVYSSPAQKGSWFTQTNEQSGDKVVMLGSKIADELFGQVDPINKVIKLDGQSYRVNGVIEEKGGGFGGPSFDNYIYLPLTTFFDNFDIDRIDSFIIAARNQNDVNIAKERIEKYMLDKANLKEDEFSVIDQTQLLETINSILGVLTLGLGGIAAISLIVGGIGIMNIMLVSVTERTREIGLRKAIGATPNIILLQFLIEAALLSVAGGMIGLLIAYLGSLAIQVYFPAKVTLNAILLAFGVSTAVGLVFGAAPARRAAKLSPIEALRYE